jgi:hypothetical protein
VPQQDHAAAIPGDRVNGNALSRKVGLRLVIARSTRPASRPAEWDPNASWGTHPRRAGLRVAVALRPEAAQQPDWRPKPAQYAGFVCVRSDPCLFMVS